jgi:hypothetical protein
MRTLVSFIAAMLIGGTLPAQENVCPCVPITHVWVVKTCSDWTCASTELALGAGDPQVIAMPVGLNDSRWLIVRRMAAGSAIDTTDDPFALEQFDHVTNAAARFATLDGDHRPMLLTAPDGQVLVIALKQPEPRRHAAVH